MNRRFIIISIIGTLLLIPRFTFAGDLEDLQAAYEKHQEAWNAQNKNEHLDGMYDEWLGAGTTSIFVLHFIKSVARDQMLAENPMLEIRRITPGFVNYRIIDDIGFVFGGAFVEEKLKDGPIKNEQARFAEIFMKKDGKWLQVAYFYTPVSVGLK